MLPKPFVLRSAISPRQKELFMQLCPMCRSKRQRHKKRDHNPSSLTLTGSSARRRSVLDCATRLCSPRCLRIKEIRCLRIKEIRCLQREKEDLFLFHPFLSVTYLPNQADTCQIVFYARDRKFHSLSYLIYLTERLF